MPLAKKHKLNLTTSAGDEKIIDVYMSTYCI